MYQCEIDAALSVAARRGAVLALIAVAVVLTACAVVVEVPVVDLLGVSPSDSGCKP